MRIRKNYVDVFFINSEAKRTFLRFTRPLVDYTIRTFLESGKKIKFVNWDELADDNLMPNWEGMLVRNEDDTIHIEYNEIDTRPIMFKKPKMVHYITEDIKL